MIRSFSPKRSLDCKKNAVIFTMACRLNTLPVIARPLLSAEMDPSRCLVTGYTSTRGTYGSGETLLYKAGRMLFMHSSLLLVANINGTAGTASLPMGALRICYSAGPDGKSGGHDELRFIARGAMVLVWLFLMSFVAVWVSFVRAGFSVFSAYDSAAVRFQGTTAILGCSNRILRVFNNLLPFYTDHSYLDTTQR